MMNNKKQKISNKTKQSKLDLNLSELKSKVLKSWNIIYKQQNGACFMSDRPDETNTRPYLNCK